MNSHVVKLLICALALGMLTTACRKKRTPAEKVGDKIEEAGDEIEDEIDEAG